MRDRYRTALAGLALACLIGSASLLVFVLDSSKLANPTFPLHGNGANPDQGPTGILVMMLSTNQDLGDPLADPGSVTYPLADQAMAVFRASNTSTMVAPLFTSDNGTAVVRLSPDSYVVKMIRDSLSIDIPAQVDAGNVTLIRVLIKGTTYPVSYSEVSQLGPSALGYQETMFVRVHAGPDIADLNDTVVVKLSGEGPEQAANATVIGVQGAPGGFTWLQLDTPVALQPVTARSMVLTTYAYTYTTTMEHIGYFFRGQQ